MVYATGYLLFTDHILQYLLSLALTQLQSSAQSPDFDVSKVLTGHNYVVLKDGSLNIVQVVIQNDLLMLLQTLTEGVNLLLFHELIIVDLLEQLVVGNILGSLVLNQLGTEEVLL